MRDHAAGDRISLALPTAGHGDSNSVDALKMAELGSFSWPLRTVADVQRLLGCQYARPTDLVAFEFSGAMRSALEKRGRIALSVDLRESATGGMHACLDAKTPARKSQRRIEPDRTASTLMAA